jgi:hypothetical protein
LDSDIRATFVPYRAAAVIILDLEFLLFGIKLKPDLMIGGFAPQRRTGDKPDCDHQ